MCTESSLLDRQMRRGSDGKGNISRKCAVIYSFFFFLLSLLLLKIFSYTFLSYLRISRLTST